MMDNFLKFISYCVLFQRPLPKVKITLFCGKLTHSYSVKGTGASLRTVGCLLMHFKEVYTEYYLVGDRKVREKGGNGKVCFIVVTMHCLENPRDGGAWWAAIYGVTQSWTRLKRLGSSKQAY